MATSGVFDFPESDWVSVGTSESALSAEDFRCAVQELTKSPEGSDHWLFKADERPTSTYFATQAGHGTFVLWANVNPPLYCGPLYFSVSGNSRQRRKSRRAFHRWMARSGVEVADVGA